MQLATPEDEIIKQDDDISRNSEIFFIGRGDCEVNVRDERGRENEGIRILEEGDHFGEIQLVYGCRRTATVISRNYNTLAKMI